MKTFYKVVVGNDLGLQEIGSAFILASLVGHSSYSHVCADFVAQMRNI